LLRTDRIVSIAVTSAAPAGARCQIASTKLSESASRSKAEGGDIPSFDRHRGCAMKERPQLPE
jgi:hypothetical protein